MNDIVSMAQVSGMMKEDVSKSRGTAENALSAGCCSVCRQEAGSLNAPALDLSSKRVGAFSLEQKIMLGIQL